MKKGYWRDAPTMLRVHHLERSKSIIFSNGREFPTKGFLRVNLRKALWSGPFTDAPVETHCD